jgi:hypothetical protein
VEKGVRWNESRRLGRLEFWHVAVRGGRGTLSPRERAGVREPVSTLAIAGLERFLEKVAGAGIAYAIQLTGLGRAATGCAGTSNGRDQVPNDSVGAHYIRGNPTGMAHAMGNMNR